MTFADPRWLMALLALPVVALLEAFAARRAAAALARLVGGRPEHALLGQLRPGQRAIGATLRLVALAFLILGAARPEWGREAVRRGSTGSDVVLVVDVSASMDARDVPPSRIDEARREALAVVDRLGGSRVGVVGFAGEAVRLCPLTLDRAAARLTIEGLTSLTIAEPGTDLGKGLRTALKMLPPGHREEQVIVLWTDGEDLEQGATGALDQVVGSGVRVFAVGVGTPAGDVVPVTDDQGRAVDIKRDENGSAVRSRLDENLLRQIGRRSRGGYFAASRPGGELPRLLASLGAVAQSGRGNRLIERPIGRFPLCALLAALLLMIERTRAGRRRAAAAPLAAASAARTPVRRARGRGERRRTAAAVLLALALAATALAPRDVRAQSAWARGDQAFRAGRYAAAESLYTLRLKDPHAPAGVRVNRATARALAGHGPEGIHELETLSQSGDRTGHEAGYNLGTLLGDAKQYEPALGALRRTLERNPEDADARWNYEVLARRREQSQSQQPRKNPQPQPSPSQTSPSQPQQNPQPSPQSNPGQAPAPSPEPQPEGAPQPRQGMGRAQAEQILDALQEMQRMDQQRQHKVRVLKERRGRDW